jgi:dihydroneopterin aldolase
VIERLLAMPDVMAVRVRVHKYTAFEDVEEVGVEVTRGRPAP